ncbi:NADPH2:quinone reductase [Kibdelosporangium banguiense]|uniref:NADPH2:quinone reductase n=1 Tax=Kibdelosporangium banguiense TaxID=1365924 RepID=A0ABS4TWI4_9PSEU|nr:zinc-binding alcohol dehydrogenase family protein [Kibdelosporangium banguiense]MBP2328325.1 NADPH2:quinone reductase [Kibdelosporangium banguiense]
MKAAVIHEFGAVPRYEDFPDPVAGGGEVLVEVKAVAVENVDKAVAAGTHFAARHFLREFPAIVVFDGIGTLPDGTLVGFSQPRPPYGALAERTVVPVQNTTPAPEGIDPAIAVVISSAVTGFAIKTAAGFTPGETVLVQGATGVAGRLAVQVARLLGAARIVATGRDNDALDEVIGLGADAVINTAVEDDELVEAFAAEAGSGYDVVLDFLWGRPTELLLKALVPSRIGHPNPTRLIQAGESAGARIALTADSVRTSGLEVYGVGKGLDGQAVADAYGQIVQWTRDGKLVVGIERAPLADIETAWQRTDLRGRRLVVTP